MANSIFGTSVWAIVVIGGFVILGAAILYARLRNKTTPEQHRRTEAATRELYDRQDEGAGRP